MSSPSDDTKLPVDDANAPLYSVGQVASMLRLQQAFLRRLDEFGVVRPVRTSGGQRRYSRVEIRRVQYVAELAGKGMTLTAIRRILELEQQVRELEEELAEARRRISELEQAARRRAGDDGGQSMCR
ncbi:MAG: helix-turn-helix domain-containing protein [Symbiobacteriaceae bacterium]